MNAPSGRTHARAQRMHAHKYARSWRTYAREQRTHAHMRARSGSTRTPAHATDARTQARALRADAHKHSGSWRPSCTRKAAARCATAAVAVPAVHAAVASVVVEQGGDECARNAALKHTAILVDSTSHTITCRHHFYYSRRGHWYTTQQYYQTRNTIMAAILQQYITTPLPYFFRRSTAQHGA
jgi:hypothetical protein